MAPWLLKGETMSQTDYARLLTDLQTSSDIREEVEALAGSAQAVLRWALGRGYELTLQEAECLLESRRELSDDELDKVAGGEDAWGSGGGTPPPTDP